MEVLNGSRKRSEQYMIRNEGWQGVENPGARKTRIIPSENGSKRGEPVISPHEFQEAYSRIGLAMERFED
ncbi:MAG: hypothetical protein GY861_01320 [bacterium]|nr:hypothetical protein [bacterium]